MNPYEKECQKSSSAIDPLIRALLDGLDLDKGGFGAWCGHIDQRRVILISDYLIAAVRQLRSNIMACASHRKVLSEKWYAESSWIRARWRSNPGMDLDVALYRGERELERLVYIDNAIKGFFASVGGALDSLGTIFVGLAGINVPITEASWSTVASSTRWLGQACKALEPAEDVWPRSAGEVHSRLDESGPRNA